jgi:maltooligosyltrehalose synthase
VSQVNDATQAATSNVSCISRALALARKHHGAWAIAVVPRCVASLNAPVVGGLAGNERHNFWQDTFLSLPNGAPESWTNVFPGKELSAVRANDGHISLGDAFAGFPISLSVPTRP